MGLLSRAADFAYAIRFLKLLVTPWDKTEAFKLGIVDEKGKTIKKGKDLKTPQEKAAYTIFHRLVFNLKRVIQKLPFGKTLVASYASALFLIREETGMSDNQIKKTLEKFLEEPIEEEITENTWFQSTEDKLMPGTYILVNNILSPITGEEIAFSNEKIIAEDFVYPSGSVFNINIYKVKHPKTKQDIYISTRDITR
jgi:uncharacterized protein YbaR (Trm112 family)